MSSHSRAFFIIAYITIWLQQPAQLHAFSLADPEKTGIGFNVGSSYDPDPTFAFGQLSISVIYDYEAIMGHRAPEPLKFKFEGNVGLSDYSGARLLASFNFYALYYMRSFETATLKPYLEGGAGLVYSDFQVEGQGLRVNFNPQAGIGYEWKITPDRTMFSGIHAYHISNGGLDENNRGINCVLVQIGYYF